MQGAIVIIVDHWYVACPSEELSSSTPVAFQVGDEHLVAFRDLSGQPRVLTDRCCHRGVPLSLGQVVDGNIRCGYHGWVFDGDGQVVEIPAHQTSGGSKFDVPNHHATEADHYIWVWMPGTSADPTYEPGIRGLTDEAWFQYSAIWHADIIAAVENQLDAAHTPFAHAGTYPGRPTEGGAVPKLRRAMFRCIEDGVSVVVWVPRDDQDSPPTFDGETDYGALFELPYRNYVFLPDEETRAIYNWVPLSEGSCRLELLIRMRSLEPGSDAPLGKQSRSVTQLREEILILAQDRVLLEGAQARVDGSKTQQSRSVASDTPQLMARKIILRARKHSPAQHPAGIAVTKEFECWQ